MRIISRKTASDHACARDDVLPPAPPFQTRTLRISCRFDTRAPGATLTITQSDVDAPICTLHQSDAPIPGLDGDAAVACDDDWPERAARLQDVPERSFVRIAPAP